MAAVWWCGSGASYRNVQCARTSPCTHVRLMARPMTLLALFACAVAVHPSVYPDDYYSESDSYSLWDDYDSIETTSAKVIIRDKRPKVNVTHKSDEEKIIKTTNISIQSHTNFIVTKAPKGKPNSGSRHPLVQIGDQYLLVEAPDTEPSSTKKPKPQHRPQPVSTRRPSTRRPSTTSRRPRTTPRRATLRPKTSKAPKLKRTTCPPKKAGWFSSFFQQKKSPKTPQNTGWFIGRFVDLSLHSMQSSSIMFNVKTMHLEMNLYI